MQVEGDHAVDAGALEEVCHKTGGDGLARGGLAVLARVAVVRDAGGDGAGRGALGGIGGNEKLHEASFTSPQIDWIKNTSAPRTVSSKRA